MISEPPMSQKSWDVFSLLVRLSAPIMSSITYFNISGINRGIPNLTIPTSTVHTIFHLYGLTNFKYCLIVLIYTYPSFRHHNRKALPRKSNKVNHPDRI